MGVLLPPHIRRRKPPTDLSWALSMYSRAPALEELSVKAASPNKLTSTDDFPSESTAKRRTRGKALQTGTAQAWSWRRGWCDLKSRGECKMGGVEHGRARSPLEDLTVQARSTHATHQAYPGLLDVPGAHVGVGEVQVHSGGT